MSLSYPFTPYFSSRMTSDPVLTEAISPHLSRENGFTLQESGKREEDQCNYETYQNCSISSSSSGIKLNRFPSTDGFSEFYSLNSNQDLDTPFIDYELEKRDELEGVVRVKEESYLSSSHTNLISIGVGGGYDGAVSTSEEYEDEEDGVDSGISSLHLTPNDTDGLSPEKHRRFSPELISLKRESYNFPSKKGDDFPLSKHQLLLDRKSGRVRNWLPHAASYPLADLFFPDSQRQRVSRISTSSEQRIFLDAQATVKIPSDDSIFGFDGNNNSTLEPEEVDKSINNSFAEYRTSPYFENLNPASSRVSRSYKVETHTSPSFYHNRPLDQHCLTEDNILGSPNHSTRPYVNKDPDCLRADSTFYNASISESNSTYANSYHMSSQKPVLLSYTYDSVCLSQRSYEKRQESRVRKACLQASNDFYDYSDGSNPGCDSSFSSYLSSYQSAIPKARNKMTLSLKQRVSRSTTLSGYQKSRLAGIRNFPNHRNGGDNRRLQSRNVTNGVALVGNGRRRHLLSFILELLNRRQNCVQWVSKTGQVFQIVDPEGLTKLWGEYKNNKSMSFESLSRSLRLYYAPKKLERIQGFRHHYRLLYPILPPDSDSKVGHPCLSKASSSSNFPHRREMTDYD